MEENKYYTPELEEFYIGFEYEIKTPILLQFIETVYSEDDFNEGRFREGTEFRVKYLDRSDIEELGWEYEKTHAGIFESFYLKRNSRESANHIGLHYVIKSNYLRIFYSEIEGDNTRFSGTIKNKSELKKLMKMLGI